MIKYDDLLSSESIEDKMKGYDDLAGIFYTGGTTGRSKGVMFSHANMVIDAFNVLYQEILVRTARWLHAAPMFHIADCAGLIWYKPAGGSHFFYSLGLYLKLFFEAVSKFKINETILVPTMVNMAVNDPEIKNYDFHV